MVTQPTSADYRRERKLRGSQTAVAEQLDIARETIVRRESGAPNSPISREAWLALLSLPLLKRRGRGTSNDKGETRSPKN